jgi:hypothetical protein
MGRARDDEELEVTAQPKGMAEELGTKPTWESGLSVDPDDLGRHFLSDATDQSNFESSQAGEHADLWVNNAAPTDEALTGPNFEGDRSIWENTVSLSMQSGGPDGAQSEVSPPSPIDEDEQSDGLHLIDREQGVDLTESVIQEGSLLDREAEELGETESPDVQTDDSKSHTKKRGGHAPKGARATPRSR